MAFVETLVISLAAAVALLFGLLIVRFAVAMSNGHDVNKSSRKTGAFFAIISGAVLGALGMGVANIGTFGGAFADVIGSAPAFFAGLIPTSLGAMLSLGWISLSPAQYIGVSMMLVFGVIFVREVDSRGA